jgi:tungstate transport system substrate-binding protein
MFAPPGAIACLKFMTDSSTQEFIAQFSVDKYGQPLFYPDAGKTDADLGFS